MGTDFTAERSRGREQRRGNRGRATAAVLVATMMVMGFSVAGCRSEPPADHPVESMQEAPPAQETLAPAAALTFEPGQAVSLFDGTGLGLWKVTDFGGQGNVSVQDGAIYLETGNYATGITWTGPLVRMDYEIALEAKRVAGSDFFCGLTFPVGEKPCTLILGGWGGTLCGLSSLDYMDASENETTTFVDFEKDKWYSVRLRVLPNRIQAWLDDEPLVDVDTTDHRIGIRSEMDLCKPLGIATWVTTGAVRNITLTRLPDLVEQ